MRSFAIATTFSALCATMAMASPVYPIAKLVTTTYSVHGHQTAVPVPSVDGFSNKGRENLPLPLQAPTIRLWTATAAPTTTTSASKTTASSSEATETDPVTIKPGTSTTSSEVSATVQPETSSTESPGITATVKPETSTTEAPETSATVQPVEPGIAASIDLPFLPPITMSFGIKENLAAPSATGAPAPGAPAPTSSSAAAPNDYQNNVLYSHNIHRSNHSANSLTWSSELESSAHKLAEQCVYKHDT